MIKYLNQHLLEIKIAGRRILLKKIKNLLYIIINLLNYLWAIPIVLLIRLIKPIFFIRFNKITNTRIGHLIFESSYYYANSSKSFIDIYWFSGESCNEYWSNLVKKNLTVIQKSKYLDYANKLIPYGNNHIVPIISGTRDIKGLFTSSNKKLRVSEEDSNFSKEWLRQKGWKDGQKFICMLIRDSAYLNLHKLHRPVIENYWEYHDYRNSEISSYNKGIEYLLSLGYWVIRLGKIANEPITIKNERIIDYPFIENQNDLIDIWLTINSSLFVSSGTGLDILPSIYNKPPVLFLNALPITHINSWHECTWTPKKLYWIQSGKHLTLKELFVHQYTNGKKYNEMGIEIRSLTSDEILDAIKEQINRLNGTWKDSEEDIHLQNKFWELLKSWELFNLYNEYINPNARIGNGYLKSMEYTFYE